MIECNLYFKSSAIEETLLKHVWFEIWENYLWDIPSSPKEYIFCLHEMFIA